MTDRSTASDPELAERLAKLRARRSQGVTPTDPDPEAPVGAAPAAPTGRRRRRRSPAATAKIVTVGASTTAVLGLLAGYGYAEQRPEGPELVDGGTAPNAGAAVDSTFGSATAMVPVAPAAPTTPPTGQVVVVLVDRSSGEQLASVTGATRDEAVAGAMEVVGSLEPAAGDPVPLDVGARVGTTAVVPEAAVPVPVPQPRSVDLAVPVPPRPPAPAPAPSAGPAPAPTPSPQASSGGS